MSHPPMSRDEARALAEALRRKNYNAVAGPRRVYENGEVSWAVYFVDAEGRTRVWDTSE